MIIAEVPFISYGDFVFAHEIAHHIGAIHHNDIISCPRGFIIPGLSPPNKTIMVAGFAAGDRLQVFSNLTNPVVGGPGTAFVAGTDLNNVAGVINNYFCEVSAINNGNFSINFSNNKACVNRPINFNAQIEDGFLYCFGPYTYTWSYSKSINGFYAIFGGNSSYATLPFAPYCPGFYVRLKVVTSDGCEKIKTKFIKCENCIPTPPRFEKYSQVEIDKTLIKDENVFLKSELHFNSIKVINIQGNIESNFRNIVDNYIELPNSYFTNGINILFILLSDGKYELIKIYKSQ
ncbi:MAG: hypothetical protein IPN29_08650 [Saprospiraceae bacterium]|nr:hypothetical protein [Saprospiraceae bacterium]